MMPSLNQFSAINEIDRVYTEPPPSSHDTSFANIASPLSTFHKFKALNPSKACGPDCIPTWVLKEYAEILASPISYVLNTSYREEKLPRTWKKPNVIPIPKDKPIRDINRHLRPILLTPILSKLAEDFVVERYVAPNLVGIPNSPHNLVESRIPLTIWWNPEFVSNSSYYSHAAHLGSSH